jgi:hypothetical protein
LRPAGAALTRGHRDVACRAVGGVAVGVVVATSVDSQQVVAHNPSRQKVAPGGASGGVVPTSAPATSGWYC